MYSAHDDPEGPGFPIRKSTDQSLFAAPHGFSQRTTSFIASCRQGIHRMPLRHLIALIIDAHPGCSRVIIDEIKFASDLSGYNGAVSNRHPQ